MSKRIFTSSEERGLTAEQKGYLSSRPDIVSMQAHSMLLPREQLYKTQRGAMAIDRAMELDAPYDSQPARKVNAADATEPSAFDNYSNDEDTFIDRHGMSSGLG